MRCEALITYKVKEKSVAAAADSVVHAVVRDGRRGVRGGQDKVQLVLFPEVKPLALIHFTLRDQLPVLVGRLGMPVAQ